MKYRTICLLALSAGMLLPACDDPAATLPPLLTRHDVEPAGERCPFGGDAIHAGHDHDGDGVLADDEIERTDVVCAPPPQEPPEPPPAEPATIVRQDDEPAGIHCIDGGLAVHSGRDDNRDGELQDDEIEETVYACSPSEIWSGDFDDVDGDDPASVAALESVRVVTGSLRLAGLARLPRLELVAGNLVLARDLGLVEVPALRRVGGNVTVDVSALGEVVLPALERVGGSFSYVHTAELDPELHAPALVDVAGSLTFAPGANGAVHLPALVRVGADLTFDGRLTEISLDALASVGGDLSLGDRVLTRMILPSLVSVGDDVTLGPAAPLAALETAVLASIGGALKLSASETLGLVRMPALARVQGRVLVGPLHALATLDVAALAQVGGTIIFTDLPLLRSLELPVLRDPVDLDGVDGQVTLVLDGVGLERLSLPALATNVRLLVVEGCDEIRSVELPSLRRAVSLDFRYNRQLESIAAPLLTRTDGLDLEKMPALVTIAFPLLTEVNGLLSMEKIAVVDFAGMPQLTKVVTWIVKDMDRLVSFHGVRVRSATTLTVTDNALLLDLFGLQALTGLAGRLTLDSNPLLASIEGLQNVSYVGEHLRIVFSPGLRKLDGLRGLRAVGGDFQLRNDANLISLAGLEGLSVVGGNVTLQGLTLVPDAEETAFKARF